MGVLVDLAVLAFYGLTFVAYLVVTAAQVFLPAKDDRTSPAGFVMKLLLRMGLGFIFYLPVIKILGRLLGNHLIQRSDGRRQMILDRIFGAEASRNNDTLQIPQSPASPTSPGASSPNSDTKAPDASWKGIIGFFHPFCNAGGGGERVLWAAIKATQDRYPNAICVVYTGDHDATKDQILARVKGRFNIELGSKVFFLYLSTRKYVLASTWPHFTLLGQSVGSVILALDAFQLLVPDIFIDTMGYAFALGCARLLFPTMSTGAYVHYPTISTDMLGSLNAEEGKGLNAGGGHGWKGYAKKRYWELFAAAYSWVGATIDVVMTNSSWTRGHIVSLWDASRKSAGKTSEVTVVFPPCAVEELEAAIPTSEASEADRESKLVYIAQFRPEKNHKIILQAFSEYMYPKDGKSKPSEDTKLVLIGSVRDSEDATRVYELRLLAHELKIKESVEFVCDATWPEILQWLRICSVGVNGMWNEHFGIGVVEYQAAGLISVVNNSGGPKKDIVVEIGGKPTGYHASNSAEYADGFRKALSLSKKDKMAMRLRARESAKRFTEAEFAKHWNARADELIQLHLSPRSAAILGAEGQMISASYVFVLGYDLYNFLS